MQGVVDVLVLLGYGHPEPLLAASAVDRGAEPSSVDIAVTLPGGRPVSGSVAGLYGTTLSTTVFSKLGPKYRLRAWLQLLALAAARPEQAWRAVTIGLAYIIRVVRGWIALNRGREIGV